jgi:hypothetical protein
VDQRTETRFAALHFLGCPHPFNANREQICDGSHFLERIF